MRLARFRVPSCRERAKENRMSRLIQCLAVCAVFGISVPPTTNAQILPGLGGCNTCQRPANTCQCTAMQPVVQTRLRPQRTVSYRNVEVTRYRQEARCEKVPVTTYQDVIVDEGGYKQVWVPKPVRKRVARQSYQNRVSYHSVPYKVTQRVPQYGVQYVPERTVQYVPRIYQTAVVPSCNTCGPTTSAMIPYSVSAYPSTPAVAVQPRRVPTRVRSTRAESEANTTSKPVPDPKYLDTPETSQVEQWQTIPTARAASSDPRLGGFQVAPSRTAARPAYSVPRRTAGNFVPAPSAAMVWQTRRR